MNRGSVSDPPAHDVATDDSPRPDRRERSRQRRRDQVYAAAVELFIKHGFDNTTMEQIADRADVARATVFNHFPRKTVFLDEWTARRRARASAAIAKRDISNWSLDRTLHCYISEMALMSEETQDETRALLPATLQQTNFLAHSELADELAALIRSARAAGAAPTHVHAGQAGLIIATAYFAVLDQWITADDGRFDLKKELLIVVNIVLYGIYAPRQPLKPSRATSKSAPRRATRP